MSHFLQNLNNNLLCAIDTETTGTDPNKHDIIQIAIIPLDFDLKPSAGRLPFIVEMRPRRPENIDFEAIRVNRTTVCEIMVRGLDSDKCADLFVEWFERQKLAYQKKIMPLACNWPFDRAFIIDWLGPATYEMCFNPHYRDLQPVALFCNDRAGWAGIDFPYPKIGLDYLCTKLTIERYRKHDAIDDAKVTAQVYKQMIQHVYMPAGDKYDQLVALIGEHKAKTITDEQLYTRFEEINGQSS